MMNALVCVALAVVAAQDAKPCEHLGSERIKELEWIAKTWAATQIEHRHVVKALRRSCYEKAITLDANTKLCLSSLSRAAIAEDKERERGSRAKAEQVEARKLEAKRQKELARQLEEDRLYPPHVTESVRVHIQSASVGRVVYLSWGGRKSSEDVHLKIIVAITNTTEDKKLNYLTWHQEPHWGWWGDPPRYHATLEDDIGNTYKRILTSGVLVDGRNNDESIYPGQTLTDLLVFERPVAAAKLLTLELPGANFGGEGLFQLKIPTSRIK